MSIVRSFLLNRIGGQIVLLILASLIAIHAFIAVSLYVSHHGENWVPSTADRRNSSPPLNSSALRRRRSAAGF